jgi:hypothetical protein
MELMVVLQLQSQLDLDREGGRPLVVVINILIGVCSFSLM